MNGGSASVAQNQLKLLVWREKHNLKLFAFQFALMAGKIAGRGKINNSTTIQAVNGKSEHCNDLVGAVVAQNLKSTRAAMVRRSECGFCGTSWSSGKVAISPNENRRWVMTKKTTPFPFIWTRQTNGMEQRAQSDSFQFQIRRLPLWHRFCVRSICDYVCAIMCFDRLHSFMQINVSSVSC